jgi:ELP3 family radical SAM enzyme/protein acetyltransferase
MGDIEEVVTNENTQDIKKINIVGKHMIHDLLKIEKENYDTHEKICKILNKLSRKYKCLPSKRDLSRIYKELNEEDPENYPIVDELYHKLIKKSCRSDSGIINISVVMPPDKFSCKYNCKFCPNETIKNGATTDMPRSYLSNEDAVQRADKVGFDAIAQTWVRFDTLKEMGHMIDKIEFRILGGTFSCYPKDIAYNFIRDLYYAANTYGDSTIRDKYTLDYEQNLNTVSKIHVVGLGIETRPDEINEDEIIRFRNYGVTRVELGVQHTDDELLKKVNRGHGIKQSKKAIKLLKDYGFKIEIHIMTDLPGATPEGDMECYRKVLVDDPDLIPDYLKDYPCLDVSYTEIKTWKEDGRWTPYSELTPDAKDLKDVLIYRQKITPVYVRVNRIQRDFKHAVEKTNYLGYSSSSIKSHLAEIVRDEAEEKGIYCQCIRCRELKDQAFKENEIVYLVKCFTASDAIEYFISAEVIRPNRNLLLGFIRLRLSESLKNSIIPELKGKTAMIRELHVYGRVKPVGSIKSDGAQHIGIGTELLKMAHKYAVYHQYNRIAVISGIGVRDYYRKRGYKLGDTYMIKDLSSSSFKIFIVPLFMVIAFILLYLYHLFKRYN